MIITLSKKVKYFVLEILATFFFIGYLPAGGTFASLAMLPFIEIVNKKPFLFQIIFLVCFIASSIYISSISEKYFNKKDDRRIVIDECVGICVSFFLIDIFHFLTIIAGFIIFRILDITKIGFKRLQSIKGGIGVVIDDIVAGILTNIILRIFLSKIM